MIQYHARQSLVAEVEEGLLMTFSRFTGSDYLADPDLHEHGRPFTAMRSTTKCCSTGTCDHAPASPSIPAERTDPRDPALLARAPGSLVSGMDSGRQIPMTTGLGSRERPFLVVVGERPEATDVIALYGAVGWGEADEYDEDTVRS